MGIGNYLKCVSTIISALMLIVVVVTVFAWPRSKTEIEQAPTASQSVSKEDFVNKFHALENRGLKIIAIEPLGNDMIEISYRNDNALIERINPTNGNLVIFVMVVSVITFALYGVGTIINYYQDCFGNIY